MYLSSALRYTTSSTGTSTTRERSVTDRKRRADCGSSESFSWDSGRSFGTFCSADSRRCTRTGFTR